MLLWIGITCLSWPAASHAQQAGNQETSVTANLLGRRIAVGQSGTFVIHVTNGRAESVPREIPAAGLSIRTQGYDSKGRLDTSTGLHQVDHFYYYAVVGGEPGTFQIPALTVRVGGVDYRTEPVELVVYEPKADDLSLNASQPYFLRLGVEKTELYEHEIVPITLSAYVRGRGSLKQMSTPKPADGDFIIKAFNRTDSAELVDIDGWEYTCAKIASAAFPVRSGTLAIDPIEMECRIERTVSRSSPGFRSLFTQAEPVTMTSNTVEIVVKPLPTEGRPAGFANTVGNFQLKATASPIDLRVGDPISVDLEVTGVGNFDNVPAPTFQGADDQFWRTYEPRRTQDPTQTSDGMVPGRVTFTQIIIPQTTASELPAFTLSFFDPETGNYQTLRSQPIPLTITADILPTAAGASAAQGAVGASGAGTIGASAPTATLTDVLSIKPLAGEWRSQVTDLPQRWAFWLPQAIPAAAVLLLLGIPATNLVRQRLADRSAADEHASFAQLHRQVATDTVKASRREFFHHAQNCLDAWRRQRPAAAGSLSAATAARLDELEAGIHQVLYSGSASDHDRGRAPSQAEIGALQTLLDELAAGLR